jgi:succinate dehydrogenase hydrophobic anchor subunit
MERRLIEAFADARESVEENPDLFARVTRSLEDARARRRYRWTLAGGIAAFVIANAVLALAFSNSENGRFNMPWWVIEMITNIVLVALAIGLGPFIKRFGRSYAADVFRANPRTGKSYLVLTDVAYYLIFTSFVLFTVSFVEHKDWVDSTGQQLKAEVARVGGILLIMGILHAANVVALPIIGGLLSSNKRLDDARLDGGPSQTISVPPLGAGTWIVRVEQAPGSMPAPPPSEE